MEHEDLMSVQEIAEYLRCSPSNIYGMASRLAIPHVRVGARLRFRMSDIKAWLDENVRPVRRPKVSKRRAQANA